MVREVWVSGSPSSCSRPTVAPVRQARCVVSGRSWNPESQTSNSTIGGMANQATASSELARCRKNGECSLTGAQILPFMSQWEESHWETPLGLTLYWGCTSLHPGRLFRAHHRIFLWSWGHWLKPLPAHWTGRFDHFHSCSNDVKEGGGMIRWLIPHHPPEQYTLVNNSIVTQSFKLNLHCCIEELLRCKL